MLAFETQLIGSRLWMGTANSLPQGKVSKCFVIAIYVEKNSLGNIPSYVAPKEFCFLVGVRRTSVASSRSKQAFQ